MGDDRQPIAEHTVYGTHYWRNSEEGGIVNAPPAEADTLVVYTRSGPYQCELTFAWPQDRHKADTLSRMLIRAYEIGDWDARKDIRCALGVPEAR